MDPSSPPTTQRPKTRQNQVATVDADSVLIEEARRAQNGCKFGKQLFLGGRRLQEIARPIVFLPRNHNANAIPELCCGPGNAADLPRNVLTERNSFSLSKHNRYGREVSARIDSKRDFRKTA